MRWNVEGADAKTGTDRVLSVDADTKEQAEAAATQKGLLVSACFKSSMPPDLPLPPSPERMIPDYLSPNTPRTAPATPPPPAQFTIPPISPGEKVLLESDELLITDKRFVIHGAIYAVANVTSVSLHRIDPTAPTPPLTVFLAIPLGVVGIIGFTVNNPGMGWTLLLIAVAVAVFERLNTKLPPSKYVIRIATASGESDALQHTDISVLQPVINSMSKAIVSR